MILPTYRKRTALSTAFPAVGVELPAVSRWKAKNMKTGSHLFYLFFFKRKRGEKTNKKKVTKHHTFTPGMHAHAPSTPGSAAAIPETAPTTPSKTLRAHHATSTSRQPSPVFDQPYTHQPEPPPVYNKNHSWLDVGAAGGVALSAAVGGGTDDGAAAAAGAGGGSSATGFVWRSIPIVSAIFCNACAAITC